MAIVDVGMAVTDLFLLSDQVEITEHTDRRGQPVFAGDMYRLDFAAVRVADDIWHVVKARKAIFQDGEPHGYLRSRHAYIQPPLDMSGRF